MNSVAQKNRTVGIRAALFGLAMLAGSPALAGRR
jgi:hypothetical protein